MAPDKPGTPPSGTSQAQQSQAAMGASTSVGQERRAGSTVAQLKDDIDSGRTGDKVNFPDLATVPLGVDDEAGGAPNTPEQVHMARQQENTRPLDAPGTDKGANPANAARGEPGFDRTSYWVGVAVAAIGVGAVGFLLASG